MWYKCEVMGQSNQVHQLKLLQKITLMKNWILWRHVKIKQCKSCNINHVPLTKMSYLSEVLSWIMKKKNTRKGLTGDQNIDS